MRRNAVILCAGLLLLLPLTLASSAAPSPWGTARPPTIGQRWGSEKAASCLPLAWEIETVDDSYGAGWDTSLELDSAGRPHIAYYDDGSLQGKYAYFDGSAWHIQVPDPGTFAGSHTSLALDAQDRPHIAYYGGSGNLKYAWFDGSAWQSEEVDASSDVGYFPSLALDTAGQPHVAYFDWTLYDLRYARQAEADTLGVWEIQVVDSGDYAGYDPSLALDAAGLPRISYYGNHDLRYALFSGAGWFTQTVERGGNVGRDTSLALNHADQPSISYFDVTHGDLKYAYYDGARWITRTLDSAGLVGEYTSLALDTEGSPRISYYDHTDGALKYACFDGSAWQFQVVDGDGGMFTSLELDAAGRPHISYKANSHLMYVHAVVFSPRAYLPLVLRGNGR